MLKERCMKSTKNQLLFSKHPGKCQEPCWDFTFKMITYGQFESTFMEIKRFDYTAMDRTTTFLFNFFVMLSYSI